eukprot:gene10580-22078_t
MNEDKLRKLDDFLHENGLGQYIKLPEIAVMGDTSSGKSSLLSALSGMQLPSASELTTRCPTRIHMEGTDDDSISASVHIEWNKSSAYRADFETRIFKGRDAFKQIPTAISEAQEFIISKSDSTVAFDVVEVELKKPDSFDVTLIDLPGFVKNPGKNEDRCIVNDTSDLCKVYLDNPLCVILAVIPANVDFHNSQIMADALEVDPSTSRTIPVITKPDLIDEGAEGGVVDLLLGRKTHDFSLGFHIVKCRGQKALDNGMDIPTGSKEEARFFQNTPPWEHVTDKTIMGVNNLGIKLADVQINMMRNAVPKIVQDVIHLKDNAEKDLKALGIDANSSDTARRQIFTDFIDRLRCEIRENLQGTGRDLWINDQGHTLCSYIQQLNINFDNNITNSRLNNVSTLKVGSKVTVTCPTTKVTCQGTIAAMEKDHCCVRSIDKSSHICYRNGTVYRQIMYTNVQSDIAWLSDLILKRRSCHLQVFLNADVFNSIIANFIQTDWLPHCHALLDEISDVFMEFLADTFERLHLPSFPEFNRWIQESTRNIFENLKVTTLSQMNYSLEGECHPFTNNHYLFEIINKARIKPLRDALKALSTDDSGTVSLAAVEAILDRNERMSCDEHILREMEITLDAYGKVAAKKVSDNFPQQIYTHLLDPLANTVHQSLRPTDAELSVLLAENQQTIKKRRELLQTIETMKKTEDAFKTFLNISFDEMDGGGDSHENQEMRSNRGNNNNNPIWLFPKTFWG